jgi:hypothetical protein
MELGIRNNILIRFLSFIEKLGYNKADVIVGTMPNLVEHVENRIGKLPNVLLYLKDTAQVFMQIRMF